MRDQTFSELHRFRTDLDALARAGSKSVPRRAPGVDPHFRPPSAAPGVRHATDEMLALYSEGMSLAAIGATFGVSKQAVWRLIHKSAAYDPRARRRRSRRVVARFWRKVKRTDSCWLWQGPRDSGGYGRFTMYLGGRRRDLCAHRFAYEQGVGPVPHGRELDHLCRVRHCVNPSHLEPVTHSVNILRGYAARRGVEA